MLESQHSLVVKALQKLYKHCINKEGFPGEPLVDVADGHPLTHAILDRLGLIKQAEEGTDEQSETCEEPLQCLRHPSTSTDYSGTIEPSPEPPSPLDSSAADCVPSIVPAAGDTCKWDLQSMQINQHGAYSQCGYISPAPQVDRSIAVTAADRLYQPPIMFNHADRYPDMYNPNDACNAIHRMNHLHASTVPWPNSYQAATQPSINMLSQYQVPVEEQPPYLVEHAGLPCNWTYAPQERQTF